MSDKLIQYLNAAKWELKDRNEPSLDKCIQYIKLAIVEAGKLNAQYIDLCNSMERKYSTYGEDDADDWSE